MAAGSTAETQVNGSLRNAPVDRLACLVRHWTWADEALGRFEQQLEEQPRVVELELLYLSAGFEIAQQYGDYRFVRVDRTSPYVVTVARRPRRSGRLRVCTTDVRVACPSWRRRRS